MVFHGWVHYKDKAGTPVLRDVSLLSQCTGVKPSWPNFGEQSFSHMGEVWAMLPIKTKPSNPFKLQDNALPGYQPCHSRISDFAFEQPILPYTLCAPSCLVFLPQQVFKCSPKWWGCISHFPVYVPLAFSFSVCQPVTHDDTKASFGQSDSAKIIGHNPVVVYSVQSLFSTWDMAHLETNYCTLFFVCWLPHVQRFLLRWHAWSLLNSTHKSLRVLCQPLC